MSVRVSTRLTKAGGDGERIWSVSAMLENSYRQLILFIGFFSLKFLLPPNTSLTSGRSLYS
jgi:hypothetical protein